MRGFNSRMSGIVRLMVMGSLFPSAEVAASPNATGPRPAAPQHEQVVAVAQRGVHGPAADEHAADPERGQAG